MYYWFGKQQGPYSPTGLNQAPAIKLFQIENGKFIKKNDKFIVSFGRYKEIYLTDLKKIQKRWLIR